MAEDFSGKNRLALAEAEEVVQVVDAVIVWEDVGDGCQVTVKRKAERSANGRDAADDVSAINGGGIPGVVGTMDSFRGDASIPAALVSGNGNGLVEKTEEAFDNDGLVISAKGRFAG